MNCKLEKFWNTIAIIRAGELIYMNCKLEKFWNTPLVKLLKSPSYMNCKLEKFWNGKTGEEIARATFYEL